MHCSELDAVMQYFCAVTLAINELQEPISKPIVLKAMSLAVCTCTAYSENMLSKDKDKQAGIYCDGNDLHGLNDLDLHRLRKSRL